MVVISRLSYLGRRALIVPFLATVFFNVFEANYPVLTKHLLESGSQFSFHTLWESNSYLYVRGLVPSGGG